LTQHLRAAGAHDDGLGVREDGGDGEAAGALDVHEEAAWCGHEGLAEVCVRWWCEKLCTGCMYLELVLLYLGGGRWVEEIYGENLMWLLVVATVVESGRVLRWVGVGGVPL
jgi:hypothetical protein